MKENFTKIKEVSVVKMPTKYWNFNLHTFINQENPDEFHIALVMWKNFEEDICLLRVHSECLTWDVFWSKRCDCGPQLDLSLKKIAKEWKWILLYLKQEWRWIGFVNKMKAYELQEKWCDTVEANKKLWFWEDLRDYNMGSKIISFLWVKKVRLLTNNPKKISCLKKYWIEIIEEMPIEIESNIHNKKYLEVKRDKMGHKIMKKN